MLAQEKYEKSKLKKTDIYGNNINFPDEIMSEMTTKGLLGKWCDMIFNETLYCLKKYYMKTNNIDCGDIEVVKSIFNNTEEKIFDIVPILEDLVIKELYGIEDIFLVVYGVTSDQVYVIKKFLELNEKIDEWDTDSMWNNCVSDERLKKVFYNF